MGSIISILMGIAFLLAFSLVIDDTSIRNGNVKDQPFANKWANKMYSLSYSTPFIWFVDEKGISPKTEKIKKELFFANWSGFFNYRSFSVFRILVILVSIIGFFVGSFLINNASTVAGVLFNIKNVDVVNSSGSTSDSQIVLLIICVLVAMLPTLILSNKANYYKYTQVKDLPLIQLFIILMLRSKRPLNEILYALSRLKTKYRDAFNVGYRIYLRDKKEGLSYLENNFDGTKFKETIGILKGLEEYSKSETIKALENNLNEITAENEAIQKKKDVTKIIMSQLTLILPFLSVILLAFAPLVVYGIAIFSQSATVFS